jgi:heptosyltransferase III
MSIAAVFQIGSLGDSIVSVPALLSIKELLPDCTDYLLISNFDSSLKVVPNHVFDMAWKPQNVLNYGPPGKGLKQLFSVTSLISQLRHYRPRYCVYLLPADREQKRVERDKLFFKLGGVKELIGFRTLSKDELAPGQTPNFRSTEAYLRLRRIWNGSADDMFGRYSSAPLLKPSESANRKVQEWLSSERRHPGRRLVVVCPYSNSPSKDIPEQVIVDLLPRLEESASSEVVLLGGQKDFARVQEVVRLSGVGINACGAFSVEESAALLAQSSLALCTDSGPMHLAGALGIPALITFSRISKNLGRWFPLGRGHTVLYRELACAGCKSINCPVVGHPCMRKITVDQILAAALSKLNGLSLAPALLGDTRVAAW